MASVPALTDLTVADLWKEVKEPDTLWGDVSQHTLRSVKLLLENRMHEELVDYLNAGRYVRHYGRAGYRNGVYKRRLITTWGTIPDLRIPRSRQRGFRPSVVAHYQQRTAQVDALIRGVFLGGLSTRQVGPVLAPLLHDTVSATTVSKVTQALDRAVAAFHDRRLADRYQYLLLDAVSMRVKTPDGHRRRLVLVAYGLTAAGPRELLDYRIVRAESQGTWEAFLTNLACRGLTGAALRLITTDGQTGLHRALELVYPHVPRQTCWVHVLRNVAQRLRVRDRDACLALARRISHARSRPAAERALHQWRTAWQRTAPSAVATVLRDWEALLAFYAVPQADWRRIRTTNAIERAFREIRRRTRPMTCFTNLASCDRIIYAVVQAFNLRQAGRPVLWQTTQTS
ncbi:MAG TPA: IS256 family transposase [bacterium]|nr:IS256 family transposase [bacterium]